MAGNRAASERSLGSQAETAENGRTSGNDGRQNKQRRQRGRRGRASVTVLGSDDGFNAVAKQDRMPEDGMITGTERRRQRRLDVTAQP